MRSPDWIPQRWVKLGRDMLAHKVRTVFVVLSVAVGIIAVAVMMGGRAVLVRALDQTFPATKPSAVTFNTTPFDEHVVRSVERRPGVAAAQGRHTSMLSYRVVGSKWKSITVYAFEDYEDVDVGTFEFGEGSRPPARGEILLETSSFDYSGLKPSDLIELEGADNKQPTLRIAGSIHDLGALAPVMSGSIVGYVSWETLTDLGEPQLFNQLDVRSSERFTTLDQVSAFGADLRDGAIEDQGVTVIQMQARQPGKQFLADIFSGVSLLLVVVGLLTLLVSGFLVVNTIGALIAQQVRQIGVMKAIGAKRGQLVVMFLAIALGYGVLGLIVALPLGQLGSNWFVGFMGIKLDYIASDLSIPTPVVALELALALLVPLLAAAIPVVRGMRMPVRHALYGSGEDSIGFGGGLVDRALGRVRGLPRPVALSLRSTFQRKGRLVLTLTTLSLAAAVFVSVGSVRASILTSVEQVGLHRAGMDFMANLYPAQPEGEAVRAARRVSGVSDAEGWLMRFGVRRRPDGTESPAIIVRGLPPDTVFFSPEMKEGRWLKPGDTDAAVVDTAFTKDNVDVSVGDMVNVKIGDVETDLRVVGIARGDVMDPSLYAARDYLDERLAAGGSIDQLQVATDRSDGPSQYEVSRRLSDDLGARQIRVTDTLTNTELRTMIRDSLSILVVFLGFLAVLLAAVGGIGLSGTMSINVLESTREIGVMRAVGASNRSIYQIFITEGVFVGVVSWAIGSVLAIPLSRGLTDALTAAVGFPLTPTFSFGGVGLWLGLVIVLSVVASLLPARRAAHVSIAEAISYE